MKKLMILLIIGCMALISNAQRVTLFNEYYPIHVVSPNHAPNRVIILDSTTLYVPQYYKDIQEYQEECWNDSVQVIVWESWQGMGFVESIWTKGQRPFNCESYPTDSILYLHTEPTFMGFIQFLNKKYK